MGANEERSLYRTRIKDLIRVRSCNEVLLFKYIQTMNVLSQDLTPICSDLLAKVILKGL